MSERRSIPAAEGDDPADLDWLADRFVLGELSAADEQAVVDRLAADDALAAAIARSSRLVVALQPPRTRSVRPASPTGVATRLAAVAAVMAAAVAIIVCWPVSTPRSGPAATAGGPGEVVRLWRQAEESVWIEDEPPAEEESADGDTVPDWMLAAVGLDGAALESQVQEN